MVLRDRHKLLMRVLKVIVDQRLIYRLPNNEAFLDAIESLVAANSPLPKGTVRSAKMVATLESILEKCAALLPKSKIQIRSGTVRNLVLLVLREPAIRSSDSRLDALWNKPAAPLNTEDELMRQIMELTGDTNGKKTK